jgi:PhnB protein
MSEEVVHPGYRTLTSYFVVKNTTEAVAWYKKAFDAVELMDMPGEDGAGYAEVLIGDSVLMLSTADKTLQLRTPGLADAEVTHMGLIYVEDVDKVFDQAVAAGAKVLHGMETHDCGARYGSLRDPFGHQWTVSVATPPAC